MPNPDINFTLGELTQFKKDVCGRLKTIEEKVDDLRVWKIKTMAQTSIITSIFWVILTVGYDLIKDKF